MKPPPIPTQTYSITLTPTILTGIVMKTSKVMMGSIKPTNSHPPGEEPPVGYVKLCTDGHTVVLADESSPESVPSLPFQSNNNGQEKLEETKDVKNFFVWPQNDETNILRFNVHNFEELHTEDGTNKSSVKLEVGFRSNQQSFPLGIATLDVRGFVSGQLDLEVKPMHKRLPSPRSIAFVHGRGKCKFVLAERSVLSVQVTVIDDANTREPKQTLEEPKQRKETSRTFRKIWNSFSFDTTLTKDRRDMDHTSQASSVISSYNHPTTCVGVAESIFCFWKFGKEPETVNHAVGRSETSTECGSQTIVNEDDSFAENITKVGSVSETITQHSFRASGSFETNITDDAGILTVLFGDHDNEEGQKMDEEDTLASAESKQSRACSAKKETFLKTYFGEDVDDLRPHSIDHEETASSQEIAVHDADEDVDENLGCDNIVPVSTLMETVEVGIEEHMKKKNSCLDDVLPMERLQTISGIPPGSSLLEDPVEVNLEQHEGLRATPTLSIKGVQSSKKMDTAMSISSEILHAQEKDDEKSIKNQVSRDAVEVGLDGQIERSPNPLRRLTKSDDKLKGMKRIRTARKVLTSSFRKPIIKLRKDARAEISLPNNNIDSTGRNITPENERIRDLVGHRINGATKETETKSDPREVSPVSASDLLNSQAETTGVVEGFENAIDKPESSSNKWFSWNKLIGISSSDLNSSSESSDSSSDSCSDYSMSATSTMTGRRVSLSAKKILKLARRLNVEPERLFEYIASLDDAETVVTALTRKVH
jgi:hypothetical protein